MAMWTGAREKTIAKLHATGRAFLSKRTIVLLSKQTFCDPPQNLANPGGALLPHLEST
jgi:hypothetical protein